MKSSLTVHHESYKLHLTTYRDALTAAKSAYLSTIFTDPSRNPRTLFSTVNKLLKPRTVPSAFKTAAVTPILKKPGLDPSSLKTALIKVLNDLLTSADTGSLNILILLDLSVAFETILRHYNLDFHCYADDTQIYLSTKSPHNPPLTHIESCLTAIKSWMAHNLLKLNSNKTELLLIGSKSTLSKTPNLTLTIDGTPASPSTQARNLGVIFEPTLSLEPHIRQVIHLSQFAFHPQGQTPELWRQSILCGSPEALEESLTLFQSRLKTHLFKSRRHLFHLGSCQHRVLFRRGSRRHQCLFRLGSCLHLSRRLRFLSGRHRFLSCRGSHQLLLPMQYSCSGDPAGTGGVPSWRTSSSGAVLPVLRSCPVATFLPVPRSCPVAAFLPGPLRFSAAAFAPVSDPLTFPAAAFALVPGPLSFPAVDFAALLPCPRAVHPVALVVEMIPLLLLCSLSLAQEPDEVRLVGGESRCAGDLEVEHQGEWRPVGGSNSLRTLKTAGVLCRDLGCGSAVSVGERKESSQRSVWWILSECVQSGSDLRECAVSSSSNDILTLACSDSVRLVNGTSLCSGRLEVNSDPSWSSVCEADFDQQDAQVVCRQLGCGAPSVLQGALYGEGEAPMWTKEFQCGGHESALLDCSSASERNTCSPGTAVSLTCSEPVRLVGGESHCTGALELKLQGEWRPVDGIPTWTLEAAGVLCRELDCGSAVSVGEREESSESSAWRIRPECVQSGSALRECATASYSSYFLTLTCSEPVRLVGGESRCAGDLEVKHQGEWRPVGGYSSLWTLKAAGVLCRYLDCGSAVSVGWREESSFRPLWWISPACAQSGSALRQCALSGSSSHFLTLTCSDSVRLLGGTSPCSGRLEVKSNQSNQSNPWSSVCEADFDQQDAQVVCRQLGCGAPSVLQGALYGEGEAPMWTKEFQCGGHESALLDCSSASERNT
ncbi:scavenger receptor cysteine-rich type 1 protein M130-like, partial [Trematomus bernacchii]|uniref:scavenger receptor cysteine-rich type 1 protein M130-like n=1 Tax=Trematomus bernacchii TaxID=40690 RepID=UPI001469F7D9